MAEKKKNRRLHNCPPLPQSYIKVVNYYLEVGDSLTVARTKWAAQVRRIQGITPTR